VKTGRREPDATARADPQRETSRSRTADRSLLAWLWYRMVQFSVASLLSATGGLRTGGREHIPATGGVLLVSNHLSYLDVFVLGILVPRPLNYVARSTLFLPLLGPLIRSVGGFPDPARGDGRVGPEGDASPAPQRRDCGPLPEGTRSKSGALGEMKPGIAVLAARARVPVVPAAVAGTLEAWPRWRPFPGPTRSGSTTAPRSSPRRSPP